jgi:predicted ATPase
VLDNCEHVIDAVANLAETFTRLCPRTTIVATSREVLRIDGESVYPVPPLDVPAVGQSAPDYIMQYSAVELFVARTRALNAGFSLKPKTSRRLPRSVDTSTAYHSLSSSRRLAPRFSAFKG